MNPTAIYLAEIFIAFNPMAIFLAWIFLLVNSAIFLAWIFRAFCRFEIRSLLFIISDV